MGPSEISHHVTPVDLQKTMRKEQIVEYLPRLSDMGYCCEKSKKTSSKMVLAVSFAVASYPGCVEGLGMRLPLQILAFSSISFDHEISAMWNKGTTLQS